jgi:hypothetical protein
MRQLSAFVATTFCFILLLMFPLTSEAQTYCNCISSSVYCDGYDNNQTTITPLGGTGGVITQDDYRGHSSMTRITSWPRPRAGLKPHDPRAFYTLEGNQYTLRASPSLPRR